MAKNDRATAGHEAAMICAAILYRLDEDWNVFGGRRWVGRNHDYGPRGPEKVDETLLKEVKSQTPTVRCMRRALSDAMLRLRYTLKGGPLEWTRILNPAKGKNTRAGLIEYAKRCWEALVEFERFNRRLDFTNGKLWLFDELPSEREDWTKLEVQPSKLSGDKIWTDGEGRAFVGVPREPDEPYEEVDVPDDMSSLSLAELAVRVPELEPGTWTTSKFGDMEMIGIQRSSFERIVLALRDGAPGPKPSGLWLARYQGSITAVEIDSEAGEVLVPGVGEHIDLDAPGLELIGPIKIEGVA